MQNISASQKLQPQGTRLTLSTDKRLTLIHSPLIDNDLIYHLRFRFSKSAWVKIYSSLPEEHPSNASQAERKDESTTPTHRPDRSCQESKKRCRRRRDLR